MALTCFKEHVRFFLSTVLLPAFFLGTFITESLICLLNEKLKGLPLISVLSGNVARAISQSKIDVHLRFCPPWLSPGRSYRTPKFLIPPSIPMTHIFLENRGYYVWRCFAFTERSIRKIPLQLSSNCIWLKKFSTLIQFSLKFSSLLREMY